MGGHREEVVGPEEPGVACRWGGGGGGALSLVLDSYRATLPRAGAPGKFARPCHSRRLTTAPSPKNTPAEAFRMATLVALRERGQGSQTGSALAAVAAAVAALAAAGAAAAAAGTAELHPHTTLPPSGFC